MYSSSARRPAAIRTTYKNRLDLGNNRGIRNVPANAVFGMKSASHERCVRSAAIVTRLAERDWSIARGVSGRFVARHSGNWATTHTPQLTCHGDDRYPSGGTAGNRSIYVLYLTSWVAILKEKDLCRGGHLGRHLEYFTVYSPTAIGATALWDPYDASPPTSEIMGTECIWFPPTFATGCQFSLYTAGSLQCMLYVCCWSVARASSTVVDN